MPVSCRYPVEFIKDVWQALTGDSNTAVADTDFGVCFFIFLTEPAGHSDVCVFKGIFHSIIQQVAEHVCQVGTVGCDDQFFRSYLQGNTDRFVGFQFVLFDEGRQYLFQSDFFQVKPEGFTAFHAHGQNLFHQSAEVLKLFLADTQVTFAFRRVIGLVKIEQGIGSRVCHGNGSLQFMGDVVGEIAFHFFQCLLTENGTDEVPEREAQNQQDNQ